MSTRDNALRAISDYEQRFRRDDLDRLEVSGLYDLFPSNGGVPVPVAASWPNDQWPYAKRAGVYLIFDEKLDLLYVGKASLNSSIGDRLYTYFREGQDHGCRIRHEGWDRPPRYVTTIAVPENTRFEAPALEEFLITRLQPTSNRIGSNCATEGVASV